LAVLRRIGLITGGYDNDYRLGEQVDVWSVQSLVNGLVSRAGYDFGYIQLSDSITNKQILDLAVSVIVQYCGAPGSSRPTNESDFLGLPNSFYDSGRSHSENIDILLDTGLLDETLLTLFENSSRIPHTAEVVVLMANLFKHIAM